MTKIIGRRLEKSIINEALESNSPQLVAVWGRRRVGKTFLIHHQITNKLKENTVFLELTGAKNEDGTFQEEGEIAANFRISWIRAFGEDPQCRTIDDLFLTLARLVKRCRDNHQRLILFLDEFPWLCAPDTKFYSRFVHSWNNLFEPEGVKVFVCGSATSWMLKNIIFAKAGLAKRVTKKIKLNPFSLKDSMDFLSFMGFELSYDSVLEQYLIIGGIPYHFDSFLPSKSIRQNIFDLLLGDNGKLAGEKEYDNLFKYLFSNHDYYKSVILFLASKRQGFTPDEIAWKIEKNKKASGTLNRVLNDLYECDFIDKRINLYNRRRGAFYFLTDEYIRFYLKWLASKPKINDFSTFNTLLDSSAYRSWTGYNFEMLCFKHINQIKNALGISGIGVAPNIFYALDEKGKRLCQVDLLLDRKDNLLTICEAKHHDEVYCLKKQDEVQMQKRKESLNKYLRKKRVAKKELNYCYITTRGLKKNAFYHKMNPQEILLEDLFQ